jgi:hypothetical protein
MIQQDAILAYLRQGNSITPLEALSRFSCFRLGARIFELKKQGYDIRSELVRGDNNKHFSRYHLIRKESQREMFV